MPETAERAPVISAASEILAIETLREIAGESRSKLLISAETIVGEKLVMASALENAKIEAHRETQVLAKDLAATEKERDDYFKQLTAEIEKTNQLEEAADQDRKTIRSLTHQVQDLMKSNEDLTRRLDVQIPEELREVSDLMKAIIPDRRCHASGCNGRRGWSGFTVTGEGKERKVTLNLCCGTVGETTFAALSRQIQELRQETVAGRFHVMDEISKKITAERLSTRVRGLFSRFRFEKGGRVKS